MHSSHRHHAVGHFHRKTRLFAEPTNAQELAKAALMILLVLGLLFGLPALVIWWVNQPVSDPADKRVHYSEWKEAEPAPPIPH